MARFKFGNKLLPNRDINFGDDSFSVAESGGELHVAANPGIRKATGSLAETVDRSLAATNGAAISSGTLTLTAIHLTAGQVVSNIAYVSATTAANGPTAQWFGLFNADRELVAVTADDTSTAWGANTLKSLALTDPYEVPTSGLYYVGILVTASSAVPTLACATGSATLNGLTPKLTGTSTGSLTTPETVGDFTAAAITATALTPYALVS